MEGRTGAIWSDDKGRRSVLVLENYSAVFAGEESSISLIVSRTSRMRFPLSFGRARSSASPRCAATCISDPHALQLCQASCAGRTSGKKAVMVNDRKTSSSVFESADRLYKPRHPCTQEDPPPGRLGAPDCPPEPSVGPSLPPVGPCVGLSRRPAASSPNFRIVACPR